jgi:hypothetical protein
MFQNVSRLTQCEHGLSSCEHSKTPDKDRVQVMARFFTTDAHVLPAVQALQSQELGAKVADNIRVLSSRLDTEERVAEHRTSVLRKAIEDMTQQQVAHTHTHTPALFATDECIIACIS